MNITFTVDTKNLDSLSEAIHFLVGFAGAQGTPAEKPEPKTRKTAPKKVVDVEEERVPMPTDEDVPFEAPLDDDFQEEAPVDENVTNADIQAVTLSFLKSFDDKAEQVKHRDALRKIIRDDFGVPTAAELPQERLAEALVAIQRYITIVRG